MKHERRHLLVPPKKTPPSSIYLWTAGHRWEGKIKWKIFTGKEECSSVSKDVIEVVDVESWEETSTVLPS